uniref:ATP-dependent transporter ycf16 n=1 Tax=Octactis speculum TaxID=3111310 RepID=A0A7S2H7W8_9STRA
MATTAGQRACKVFHENLVKGVLSARMEFFDTTPLGRILNRFSKDTYTIDEQLPMTMYSWVSCLVTVVVAVVTIAYVTPLFLVACLPMGLVYYRIMVYYVPTARELKRLDSVSRSPIFSHFGESLDGASTIRAFRAEMMFEKINLTSLERNIRAYYAYIASNRWLACRLEAIGTAFTFIATILAVVGSGALTSGEGGLSITYALSITQTLNWLVRMSSDRESQVVAVERVDEYAQIQSEAPPVIESYRPSKEWPTAGAISFKNAKMRYRKGLPLVLKGLTVDIKAGSKVGVVGRTGAGKSSLLLVLLRLIEPDSDTELVIDGIDTLRIGLLDLRKNISIIPQDPVLFTGTVRFNLDPFNHHDDTAIWDAIKRAHLHSQITARPGQLNAEVDESGKNFSMGERQLLCLGRALLRNSRILLLDEATSAVDQHTDKLVQETIRSAFKDCTVLTIAHRLDTIIDYDRVLVLAQGEVVEDDTPTDLLNGDKYPDGLFKAMWDAHEQGLD